MKIVVCGGRDYTDIKRVYEVMADYRHHLPDLTIIHGGASGADTLAANWAKQNGCHILCFIAKWHRYGPAAGPMRNKQMLDEHPDLVIAFPGGRGTAHMVRIARAAGVEVREVS